MSWQCIDADGLTHVYLEERVKRIEDTRDGWLKKLIIGMFHYTNMEDAIGFDGDGWS